MSDPFRFISSTDAQATTATDDPGASSPAGAPHHPPEGQADQPQAQPDAAGATELAVAAPAAAATPSAAEARFQSCRWRKPETPPFCSHPEVLPFAGTNGFKPDAWCPGCAFYKLRRNPRRDY